MASPLTKDKDKKATVVGNYSLGAVLGKGGFGTVYQGLDVENGDFVAVKQINLQKIPKDQLNGIMQEIDLLKNLNHANIVKYIKYVKTKDSLYIVLEFVETGSLQNIVKKFGKFPEPLVCVYITQVLEGLVYLHEQGVVHRDIKGANILTTKEGLIKLADFGVATKFGDESAATVVGTPYWMAPEIIELNGATPASDIWSVGCTVIELLSGNPPYYDLGPMPALFRIVQDDYPPLPEGISPALKDWLMQCFQKDPLLRISAQKLLKHKWIQSGKRKQTTAELATPDHATKNIKEYNEKINQKSKVPPLVPDLHSDDSDTDEPRSRHNSSSHRKHSNGSNHHSNGKHKHRSKSERKSPTRNPILQLQQMPTQESDSDSTNWDRDFNFSPQVARSAPSSSSITPPPRKVSTSPRKSNSPPKQQQHQSRSKSPSASPPKSSAVLATTPSPPPANKPLTLVDTKNIYSDEVNFDDDFDFSEKSNSYGKSNSDVVAPLKGLIKGTSLDNDDPFKDMDDDSNEPNFDLALAKSKQLSQTQQPQNPQLPATLAQSGNMKRGHRRTESNTAIEKWHEEEDAAWDDVGAGSSAPSAEPNNKSSNLNLKLTLNNAHSSSNASSSLDLAGRLKNKLAPPNGVQVKPVPPKTLMRQASTADISDDDIFREFEDELDDDFDFDKELIKDNWARMSEQILKLMGRLQPDQSEDVIFSTSQELIQTFKENPAQMSHLIRRNGIIPIMEMLEVNSSRVLHCILQVVNQIIENNQEIQENLCLVGGIPAIMKFAGRDYSLPIRLECAYFVSKMCSTSTLTLQMIIACRGLPVLVDILSTPYDESKALVWMALDAIVSVFELQSTTPKNDFCRLFAKCGLMRVLVAVLRSTVNDDEAEQKKYPEKIANILLVFSAADGVVKIAMATQEVLSVVLDLLDRVRPEVLSKMLKSIKQLSMDHNALPYLQRAGTIKRLVPFLGNLKGPNVTEIHNQVLNAMYNLCRLDQERQYQAAAEGVVPYLQQIIASQSPLKQFALPLICDLAHVKRARTELWRHRGVEFYLDLLSEKYWQVSALDSLSVWLVDETKRLEAIITQPTQINKIIAAFESAEQNAFVNLMDPMLRCVTASSVVNVALATSSFVPKLLDRLQHPNPTVRVNLLKILTSLYECHPNPKKMIAEYKLYPIVKRLTEDRTVLVQKMASKLLIAFTANTVV